MHNTNKRIKNLNDLKLIKERCYYELRFSEEQAFMGLTRFKTLFMESLKNSARIYGQRLLILSLMKLMRTKK